VVFVLPFSCFDYLSSLLKLQTEMTAPISLDELFYLVPAALSQYLTKLHITFSAVHAVISVLMAIFPRWTSVSRFIGGKDDGSGGDNWSYETIKAPVKSSPTTNHLSQAGCPSCCPTVCSVHALYRAICADVSLGNYSFVPCSSWTLDGRQLN